MTGLVHTSLNLLKVNTRLSFSCASEFNHGVRLQNFLICLLWTLSLLLHILKNYNR